MDYTTITSFNNFYSKLKPKQQSVIRERDYNNFFTNFLASMVKFNGFPESVDTRNLNIYRVTGGDYSVTEYKGELVALYPQPVGVLDLNGEPINIKCSSAYAPVILDRVNGKDAIVGHNTSLRYVDANIGRFSHMFAQIDLSMIYNLFYSRLNKVFATDDEETTKVLQEILDSMDYGKLKTITSKNIMAELNHTMSKPIQEINLTDVDKVDRIQYLSNFYQDLLKRFCWLYGVPMNNSPKMAQQSVEEISNASNGSNVLLFDIMENANKFCDKVNKLYGLNTSATLGDAWEQVVRSEGLKTDSDGLVFPEVETQERADNDKKENAN